MDESKLDLALDAYINKDFPLASQIYNDILPDHSTNPFLLNNSAISDYESQNIGSALVKLYRAKKIEPRNKTITNNIELIENKIQLNNPKIFTLNFINLGEALILVLFFNILFILKSKISSNKILKLFISMSFVFSLIIASITYIEQGLTRYALVTSISANTYSGNNTAYSQLYELFDGQLVKLIKIEKEWSQIKYNENLSWVENERISLL